jgi:hypothetical protein
MKHVRHVGSPFSSSLLSSTAESFLGLYRSRHACETPGAAWLSLDLHSTYDDSCTRALHDLCAVIQFASVSEHMQKERDRGRRRHPTTSTLSSFDFLRLSSVSLELNADYVIQNSVLD